MGQDNNRTEERIVLVSFIAAEPDGFAIEDKAEKDAGRIVQIVHRKVSARKRGPHIP